jgi:hypothetical protein
MTSPRCGQSSEHFRREPVLASQCKPYVSFLSTPTNNHTGKARKGDAVMEQQAPGAAG